ncbi:hypothetical protein FQA39_LY10567 [Lamprigera yunnana]|nr:hypothetical protein FQA39_LY10567 [Lamprigera yunnana]
MIAEFNSYKNQIEGTLQTMAADANVRVICNTFRQLTKVGIHRVEPGINLPRYDPNVKEDIMVWNTMHENDKYPVHGADVQSLEEQDPHR